MDRHRIIKTIAPDSKLRSLSRHGAIGASPLKGESGADSMSNNTLRVFLSHTSDFGTRPTRGNTYPEAAIRAVNSAEAVLTDMSLLPATEISPAELSAGLAADTDLYIGIIGWRYGSPVRGTPDVSYTQLEFRTAGAGQAYFPYNARASLGWATRNGKCQQNLSRLPISAPSSRTLRLLASTADIANQLNIDEKTHPFFVGKNSYGGMKSPPKIFRARKAITKNVIWFAAWGAWWPQP
jgi:hypothetical protein